MVNENIQNVNLYQRRNSGGYYIFTYSGGVRIISVFTFVLFFYYSVGLWANHQLKKNLDEAAEAHRLSENHLLEVAEANPTQKRNAQLEAQIEMLANERDTKARMLSLLSRQSLGKSIGFSRHLSALSEKWVDDTWLKNIHISEGGKEMRLTGNTLDATRIPLLLQRLQHEPAFSGVSFKVLRMTVEDESIAFYLQTSSNKEASKR